MTLTASGPARHLPRPPPCTCLPAGRGPRVGEYHQLQLRPAGHLSQATEPNGHTSDYGYDCHLPKTTRRTPSPTPDYPAFLAIGGPIASGLIEGARRWLRTAWKSPAPTGASTTPKS